MAFLSELKQFFINSFSSPVYQDGVLYFIIEELPNPRDSGLFKILCGSTQIALNAVTYENGRTGEIRTRDQRIKSPLLYRLSYRPIYMAIYYE